MKIGFIAQPHNGQLGHLLIEELKKPPRIKSVTIISAFVSRATTFRLKAALQALQDAGAKIMIVLGVDMGGTSKEALQELASWSSEVFIFKNKKSGVTFHPKIYLVERDDSAELFIGSNNLTDGGLFKNYEGTVHLSYSLSTDGIGFAKAKADLSKFLDPKPPVANLLDKNYLEKLLKRSDIPSETEVRKRAKTSKVGPSSVSETDDTFGFEATPGAISLPPGFQDLVLTANLAEMSNITQKARSTSKNKKATKKQERILFVDPLAQLSPVSFYMELNATKGARDADGKKKNIPGEQRIPLEAIWSAQDFWGWPNLYSKSTNPGAGRKSSKSSTAGASAPTKEDRIYYSWNPMWQISDMSTGETVTKKVRMYYYENSSDFRFTSGDIAKWGSPGDIVKITRMDNGTLEFTCELVKKGHPTHAVWATYCKHKGRSARGYGFS